MSKHRIREAGKEALVRELAAAGHEPREIAATLAAQGIRTTGSAVTRLLAEEAAARQVAADSAAADVAVESVRLGSDALHELIRDGLDLAKRAKKGDEDGPRPKEWAEVARAITSACAVLNDVTRTATPIAAKALPLAQVNERVRAIFGLGDIDAPAPIRAEDETPRRVH